MKGTPAMAGLVALALLCALAAVLYASGSIGFLTSDGATGAGVHHYKHALAFGVVAVLCLVAASFARPQNAIE